MEVLFELFTSVAYCNVSNR